MEQLCGNIAYFILKWLHTVSWKIKIGKYKFELKNMCINISKEKYNSTLRIFSIEKQFKHQNICIKSYLHDIICRIRMLHTSKRRFSTFTINIHYSRSNNCIRENANGTIRTVVSCRFCGIVWSTCGKSTRYCGCCNAMATVTLQDRQSFNLIWLKKVRWPAPPDFSNWGRPQSPISPPGRTMEGHWTIYIYIYTWKDNCSPNHWTTKWSPNWPTWRPFWMSVSGPTRLF